MSSVQTMKGWPSRIGPGDAIPHPFQKPFEALRITGQEFPDVVYGPPFRFDRYENTAKLLAWAGERVACLDARRGGVVTTELALADVHRVEWGGALLESWIRLDAHGARGDASIRVSFNTVCRDLYQPLVAAARERRYAGSRASAAVEVAKLDPLNRVDYKFMSFGREALLPGAEVRRFWMQPRVSERIARVFKRTRIPACMLLLTQSELILIREGDGRNLAPYAVVSNYLPLDRIEKVVLEPVEERDVVQLRVLLPGEAVVRCDLDRGNDAAARELLGELRAGPPTVTASYPRSDLGLGLGPGPGP